MTSSVRGALASVLTLALTMLKQVLNISLFPLYIHISHQLIGRPPCGFGADCVATRYKAICACPKTHTGDPFVSCRPFTKADLCNPNPCGPNAFCEPGVDNLTGEDRPVCLCEQGYRGEGEGWSGVLSSFMVVFAQVMV